MRVASDAETKRLDNGASMIRFKNDRFVVGCFCPYFCPALPNHRGRKPLLTAYIIKSASTFDRWHIRKTMIDLRVVQNHESLSGLRIQFPVVGALWTHW